MEILVLFLLFFYLSAVIAMIMDLMMGISLFMSLRNLKNPFWIMTFPEYVIVFIMLSIMFIPSMFSFFKQRKQTQTREKT